ncbi:MAG: PilT/PilU family type 4a pilus ATPase [Gemmatimonadota bacterium]
MEQLVKAAVQKGASVIHIKAGDVFRCRVEGKVYKLSSTRFTAEDTRRIALQLIPNDQDRARINEIKDYDCSWGLDDVGRFRVNILQQRGSFMIIMRAIPWSIPTLEELNLPSVLTQIADQSHGLVLVTGGVGTGKTTTQASMIDWVNKNRQKHIITLEDPIEFLHTDDASTITQREIGVDTDSFRTGLRAALRQDPDIILIGEMRDKETMETAIRASELGQLVLSTMHTPTATSTISQLLAVFPDDEKELARIRVADTLRAVVSQRLLMRADGETRIPALEIMQVTAAIQDCILSNKPAETIQDLIEAGRETYGMQSFQQCLQDLVQSGQVSYEAAKSASENPGDFELYMQTLAGDGQADPFGPAVGSRF